MKQFLLTVSLIIVSLGSINAFARGRTTTIYPGEEIYANNEIVRCQRRGGGGGGHRNCREFSEWRGYPVSSHDNVVEEVCSRMGYASGYSLNDGRSTQGQLWWIEDDGTLQLNRGGGISDFKCCN